MTAKTYRIEGVATDGTEFQLVGRFDSLDAATTYALELAYIVTGTNRKTAQRIAARRLAKRRTAEEGRDVTPGTNSQE